MWVSCRIWAKRSMKLPWFPGFSRWVFPPFPSVSQEIGPIGVLGPSASLGEAALLGLLHVRTASVQALQDSGLRQLELNWYGGFLSHGGSHFNHRRHRVIKMWSTELLWRFQGHRDTPNHPQIESIRPFLHWNPRLKLKWFKMGSIVLWNPPVNWWYRFR